MSDKFNVTLSEAFGNNFQLAVATDVGMTSPVLGPVANPTPEKILKVVSPSLAAGKYYWDLLRNGTSIGVSGEGRVAGPTHKITWASCATELSNAPVFSQIEAEDPDFFIHAGDFNYYDRTSADPLIYRQDIEACVAPANQASLYSKTPLIMLIDDHNGGGGNDHPGNTPAAEAAASAYRTRFAYPGLVLAGATDGLYHTFDVGRVRYIVTDQRRYASNRFDADNASKTILGAAQKAWLKGIIENSPGMLLVMVSTRVFHANTITNHDSWGGFTTERTELCDHIRTHASGRFFVLTGDRHQAGIDDGTNCDYATLGDPIVCAMAAPLDRNTNTHGGATFSSGVFSNNGQYGLFSVTDTGGPSITVDIAVKNSSGTVLASLNRIVTL